MSHLRDTALLTQGSKDSASPSQLQEPFLMEQLPREMQCQFILKPTRLATAQQLSGELLPLLHRALLSFAKSSNSPEHKLNTKAKDPTSTQMNL